MDKICPVDIHRTTFPYFSKRLFFRCCLISLIMIILKWMNGKLLSINLRQRNEYKRFNVLQPRFYKRNMEIKCNYNVLKVSVPCQTPAFQIDLCLPHCPVILDTFNSTYQRTNVTVVTGYFNLGSFRKGDNELFTSKLYKNWMQIIGKIRNHMVIFVENNTTEAIFRQVRASLPSYLTRIIRVKRSDLWAFKIENSIRQIYTAPCYPKFHPNTVLAGYSCVMHAKYDLIRFAAQKNYFETKYFSWMDVGYFRDEPKDGRTFSLGLPKNFDENRIAFTEVYPRQPKLTVQQITFQNLVWVGGGFFVGRGDVILKWVGQYQAYVYKMLQSGLMNTDQQVIYSMFNDKLQNTSVRLQVYKAQKAYHNWFTLGYMCKTTP